MSFLSFLSVSLRETDKFVEGFSLIQVEDAGSGEDEENAQKCSYNLSEVIELNYTENTDGRIEYTSKVAILINEHVTNHTQDHAIGHSLHRFKRIIPYG
jgi:hypothetical protein